MTTVALPQTGDPITGRRWTPAGETPYAGVVDFIHPSLVDDETPVIHLTDGTAIVPGLGDTWRPAA